MLSCAQRDERSAAPNRRADPSVVLPIWIAIYVSNADLFASRLDVCRPPRSRGSENGAMPSRQWLDGRPAFQLESPLDALEQAVAYGAVGGEDLIAMADLEQSGNVERRPVLDVDRHGPGQLERLMVRFRRERDDQIECRIVKISKRLRLVARQVDADFVHDGFGERIAIAGSDAGRFDIDALPCKMPQDCRRHRRSNGIHGAGEQYSFGCVPAPPDHVTPSSAARTPA